MLGEGARWDARRDELLRVDILAGRVYRDRVADDGGLVPVRTYAGARDRRRDRPDRGRRRLAARRRTRLRPPAPGRVACGTLAEVAPAGTRMNDGACDPQGRFWAGTLADDHHARRRRALPARPDGRIELVLDGLTISNGLGWSPDGGTMYLVDSGPGWSTRSRSTAGPARSRADGCWSPSPRRSGLPTA